MPVREETVAGQDRQILPVRAGKVHHASSPRLAFPLNREVELVQVGLAKAALRDFEEPSILEFFLIGAYAALS